jgi:uncharacterized membrane protein
VALPISVEEGIRMVISGGILLPDIPAPHARQVSEWPSGTAPAAEDAPVASETVAR